MHSRVFCLKPVCAENEIFDARIYDENEIADRIIYADYVSEVNLLAPDVFKDIEFFLGNSGIFNPYREGNRFFIKINREAILNEAENAVSNLKEWLERAGDDAPEIVLKTRGTIVTELFGSDIDVYICVNDTIKPISSFIYDCYDDWFFDTYGDTFEIYQMFDTHF